MNRKILLFSHDPGGANTVIPLASPLKNKGYKVLLYGKNHSLVKYSEFGLYGLDISKRVKDTTPESLKTFLIKESPSFVITGTSAKDMTERYLWQAASELGIPSFAIIDSWINYKMRFLDISTSKGSERKIFLPTKICLIDSTAKELAVRQGFKKDSLLITGHPYFELLLRKRETLDKQDNSSRKDSKKENKLSILFISEPISKIYKEYFNRKKYLGYTEKTIFKNIYKSLENITNNNRKVILLIKLHPKESASTYNTMVNGLEINSNIRIKIIKNSNIPNWELIYSADIICGMYSMMLVEAYLLGKPVISVQIGLRRENPFILDKQNIIKSILSQKILNKTFSNLVEKKIRPKYNYKVIKNPVKNIINNMEKIIWQNLQ